MSYGILQYRGTLRKETYTYVGTISCLEVEHRGPIIRSILLETTGCARRETTKVIIVVHGNVERVL